jgi:peptidoglycan hydrolase-like protein with peptidoglycan-binding domain
MPAQGFSTIHPDATVIDFDLPCLSAPPDPWQEVARALPCQRLKLGDSGDVVQRLHLVLHCLCLYVGPIDGHFGTATERAVLRLQRQLDLSETGHFDHLTWHALQAWADLPY